MAQKEIEALTVSQLYDFIEQSEATSFDFSLWSLCSTYWFNIGFMSDVLPDATFSDFSGPETATVRPLACDT